MFSVGTGTAVPRLKKLMVDAAKTGAAIPKRHDLGGRRSGSVGTAPLDHAHDLLMHHGH